MNPDNLPSDLKVWLPRLYPFQQGGLEPLIKAVSGLAQVGPKPELISGVNANTWPTLRSQLLNKGLIKEEKHPFNQVPFLRFSPELERWLKHHANTEVRLSTRRQHQRHYFQFCGQLSKQQRHSTDDAQALAALEMPNLLSAVHGVLEQGEEWGLEFAQRLLPFLASDRYNHEHKQLSEQAESLARHKGRKPWQLHLSNRAQQLYESGQYHPAEQALHALIAELDDQALFEQCSSWARIGACRGRLGQLASAAQAYRHAHQLSAKLTPDQALLEMRRSIALDLSQLCDATEASQWLETAIISHAQLQHSQTALKEYDGFMQRIENALNNPQARQALNQELEQARAADWRAGADAIDRLLDGERNLAELSRYLDLDDAALIHALLKRLKTRH